MVVLDQMQPSETYKQTQARVSAIRKALTSNATCGTKPNGIRSSDADLGIMLIAINSNKDTLLKCLDPNELFIAQLLADDVIDEPTESRLVATKADIDRNVRLVECLEQVQHAAFYSFLLALLNEEQLQIHLYNVLWNLQGRSEQQDLEPRRRF